MIGDGSEGAARQGEAGDGVPPVDAQDVPRDSRRATAPDLLRAALGPLAGAGLALGFPDPGWVLLGLGSLTLLFGLFLTAPTPRRAAWEGLVAGFVFFGLLLRWFAAVILEYTSLGPFVAAAAVLMSGATLAPFVAAIGGVAARLRLRWGGLAGAASLAALWAAFEVLRAHIPFPFPWGTISALGSVGRDGSQLFALLGSVGTCAWISLGAALAAEALTRRPSGMRVLAHPVFVWAAVHLVTTSLLPAPVPARRVTVGVCQASLPRGSDHRLRLATYEELAREAATRGVDLVVWPESAVAYRIDGHPRYRERIEALAAELEIDLIVGSVTTAPGGGLRNSAALIRAHAGLASVSSKRQLVPFGEYLPMRFLFGERRALAAAAGDFEPGTQARLHPAAVGRVGVLVCYEAVFPQLAGEYARRGADLLVTITNDSWFGWTSGPRQHLAHSVPRAAECRLPLVRAANSGISAIVDGDGRVLSTLGTGERGVLVESVGLGWPRAAAALWVGQALRWLCAILSLLAISLAFWPRHRPGTGEARDPESTETPHDAR